MAVLGPDRGCAVAVRALTAVMTVRATDTAAHQGCVAWLAREMGRRLGFAPDRLEGLRVMGLLHDLGKLCVPAGLLYKPGRLSAAEYVLVQDHVPLGVRMIRDLPFPWPVARAVGQHHERLNGSGYPQGLQGQAILPEARILAVADVVAALAAPRPYRPALRIAAALAEITGQQGVLYDPEAVEVCVSLLRGIAEKSGFTYNNLTKKEEYR